MSRRKIESPSIGSTEELRQMETNSSERKSVFERLGRLTRTIDTNRRVVTTRNDYEEMDLRLKMDRKRRNPIVSPNRSLSPQSRPQQSSVKSLSHKSDDNNKVKSLVLAPNRRSESPKTHSQSVTSSSNSSSVKRSKLSTISLSNEQKFLINKWEDDIDDEELEKKRLQLQRELQELEISGSLEHREKSDCLPSTLTVSDIRSRSSSILSSESGSYSSTIKSFSKTESSCSDNTDKKSNIKSTNKEQNVSSNKSISSEKKTHVSSSISRKESNLDLDSSHKKSDILKFDRHGNVRVSLDEQERQKRLRAERFSEKKSSPIDATKKKPLIDSKSVKIQLSFFLNTEIFIVFINYCLFFSQSLNKKVSVLEIILILRPQRGREKLLLKANHILKDIAKALIPLKLNEMMTLEKIIIKIKVIQEVINLNSLQEVEALKQEIVVNLNRKKRPKIQVQKEVLCFRDLLIISKDVITRVTVVSPIATTYRSRVDTTAEKVVSILETSRRHIRVIRK